MTWKKRVNRVHDPDVRPLVREALRCYTSGAARACVVLTWTAVCTDLINKIVILREEGEPEARDLAGSIERAQGKTDKASAEAMLNVERDVLEVAHTLELIDSAEQQLLERLRIDRHLSAHPSLRPLGELYTPTTEYARAHLATALEAVLVHPPSQGRKVVEAFREHVVTPAFHPTPEYLAHVFFDRVRPAVRRKVVDFAVKFAVLELPPEGLSAEQFADRMAACVRVFAERDSPAVRTAMAKINPRLETSDPSVQVRALARLGQLDAFWDELNEPMRGLFNGQIEKRGEESPNRYKGIAPEWAMVMGLITRPDRREGLPALETAFPLLNPDERAEIVFRHPDPYFAPHLAALLTDARSWNEGEFLVEAAVLPCAKYLTAPVPETVCREWANNIECWGRRMPELARDLYESVAHLGEDRKRTWGQFIHDIPDSDKQGLVAALTGFSLPGR